MLRTFAAALCLLGLPAHALLITVDPDDFAAGTNISNAFEGVSLATFASAPGGYTVSRVYAAADPRCTSYPDDCFATTGSNVFSRTPDPGTGFRQWWSPVDAAVCLSRVPLVPLVPTSGCSSQFVGLLIAFEVPTNYVEISGVFLADSPQIYALDADRNILGAGTYTTGTGNGNHGTQGYSIFSSHYQSGSANIAYAIAGGWGSVSSLDALRYEAVSVPEPSTLALLAVALLGFATARSRRQTVD